MAAAEQQARDTGGGPVIDWAMAEAVARRLVGTGPDVPVEEAVTAVRRLRALAVTAEGHVRELTGLGAGLPLLPGDVVDRAGWVQAATDGLAVLTSATLDLKITPSRVASGAAGVQAGLALGYLGSRVLGQYDPFGGGLGGQRGPGRLLLVAPNVVAVQHALDVPAEDFRLWVCLHEATHRLQFTGVPWLRDHFADLVGTFLSTMDTTASGLFDRLPDALRAARRDAGRPDAVGLIAYLQAPEQRDAMNKLLALATLLEGHADHVMDAVGPQVVPSVATIRARFSARRRGGGVLDRLLRALLGVDAKIRQYARGSAFTRHVIDAAGMDGFNTVWTSPRTLPTRREIDEPAEWLRRVRP
ncbi:MAG TPA: zinc-dependent metalloprotease [Pseudonocardiaceae bacterium]